MAVVLPFEHRRLAKLGDVAGGLSDKFVVGVYANQVSDQLRRRRLLSGSAVVDRQQLVPVVGLVDDDVCVRRKPPPTLAGFREMVPTPDRTAGQKSLFARFTRIWRGEPVRRQSGPTVDRDPAPPRPCPTG